MKYRLFGYLGWFAERLDIGCGTRRPFNHEMEIGIVNT